MFHEVAADASEIDRWEEILQIDVESRGRLLLDGLDEVPSTCPCVAGVARKPKVHGSPEKQRDF
jgi:hypothetical protein